MHQRTVVSWNAMISGYSRWGKYNEALHLLSLMHCSNMKLNETTCSTVLSVCARSQSLSLGQQIHALVFKSSFQNFEFVGTSLLYLRASCWDIEGARKVFDDLHERNELLWGLMLVGYVQCNLMNDALCVFNTMPHRDVVAWTTLISGYSKCQDGCPKALELFQRMRGSGESVPNEFTLDCVIRACGRMGASLEGKGIHGILIKSGFEFEITGALLEFYCNSELIDDAKRVYGGLVNPSLDHSNMLIQGLLTVGRVGEAELVFNGLDERDPISYNQMIKGYAQCGQVDYSEKLFREMPKKSLVSFNTMIHAYSRIGEIDKALEFFEAVKGEGSAVTWNSIISGFIENDQHEMAIRLYIDMRRLSITYSRSTFSALFRACSCLGSLQQGLQIHGQSAKTPFESNVYVATALIDMYSKCGRIADAQASFGCISNPNVAAWTALIYGYAYHGLGSKAIVLFERMLEQGVKPNAATFVAILSACTGAGLINEGMQFFLLMKDRYGISPSLEHFTCVVSLLGRSGHLRVAEDLINEMPFQADDVLLITMLNACWCWKDLDVGKRVAEKLFALDPKPIPACVIMSNLYAKLGRWAEKMTMRKMLNKLEVKKDPGCSWIELNNRVHIFSVDGRSHPCYNVIYATLKHLTANVDSCPVHTLSS
ncbi:hypothetical protein M9H77_26513 [Catharanthus roseus]|uniref:Uncharacterized protein n=1 Tax=Catharanthus roseus TaxID=4058 RepID=A0ACC0ABE5_CATRO|nr:hypothetical protein M9H77_26513 [Catharanthus roseus]